MEKHVIKAVHEKNVEELLVSLGMLEELKSGKLNCSKCNRVINMQNLLCLYPDGDKVRICCNARECYESVLRETS